MSTSVRVEGANKRLFKPVRSLAQDLHRFGQIKSEKEKRGAHLLLLIFVLSDDVGI